MAILLHWSNFSVSPCHSETFKLRLFTNRLRSTRDEYSTRCLMHYYFHKSVSGELQSMRIWETSSFSCHNVSLQISHWMRIALRITKNNSQITLYFIHSYCHRIEKRISVDKLLFLPGLFVSFGGTLTFL